MVSENSGNCVFIFFLLRVQILFLHFFDYFDLLRFFSYPFPSIPIHSSHSQPFGMARNEIFPPWIPRWFFSWGCSLQIVLPKYKKNGANELTSWEKTSPENPDFHQKLCFQRDFWPNGATLRYEIFRLDTSLSALSIIKISAL